MGTGQDKRRARVCQYRIWYSNLEDDVRDDFDNAIQELHCDQDEHEDMKESVGRSNRSIGNPIEG